MNYFYTDSDGNSVEHPRLVQAYQSDAPTPQLNKPTTISGDRILPSFGLDLSKIW